VYLDREKIVQHGTGERHKLKFGTDSDKDMITKHKLAEMGIIPHQRKPPSLVKVDMD
jgi:hypothetical protein